MHAEDEADDQLIVDALQSHVITRSQSQAVERAKQNALVPSVTPQSAASKRPSKKGAKAVLVSKPLSAAKDYLDVPMSEMQASIRKKHPDFSFKVKPPYLRQFSR